MTLCDRHVMKLVLNQNRRKKTHREIPLGQNESELMRLFSYFFHLIFGGLHTKEFKEHLRFRLGSKGIK